MIDWDTYSELYRRLFITTLQPTREPDNNYQPRLGMGILFWIETGVWNFVLQSGSHHHAPLVSRLIKPPSRLPPSAVLAPGKQQWIKYGPVTRGERERERGRGEAGDKQRNLNSKLRAAEEGPSSRTLARGAGTSIRLILILQQQAVPHLRGNMSYYTGPIHNTQLQCYL